MLNFILKLFISVTYAVLLVSCSGSTESFSSPSFDGSAIISWYSPTSNTDGSELIDLNSYIIYYGLSPDDLASSVSISNIGLNTYVIDKLKPNTTYFFAIKSVNSNSVESPYSTIVSKYTLK